MTIIANIKETLSDILSVPLQPHVASFVHYYISAKNGK